VQLVLCYDDWINLATSIVGNRRSIVLGVICVVCVMGF
jgi:hypothetical protein